MNKYYNPRLLNTVVTGSGMQHPRRPHVILGKYPGEYVLGDLMDANAIQELTSDKQATYSINTDYDENSDYTNAIAETLSTEEITPKIGDIMVVNPIKNDIIYEDLLENYKVTKVTANTNETLNIDAFPATVGTMLVTTYGSTLNAIKLSIDTYNIDVSINNEVNTVISNNFGWTDDALTYLNNLFLNLTISTINHSYDNLCDPLFIFDVETDPISYQYTKDGWEKTSKDAEYYVETTWSELKTLKDNLLLQSGYDYRITDYQCTTTQENTKSAGHQFDIIVTALSNNTLNEEAKAVRHNGDTYFPSTTKFEAWKIWYRLDNDTAKFAWAGATNGKGVIYRMIDEFENDCPYDFKNILFIPYFKTAVTWYAYTFNSTAADGGTDLSIDGKTNNIYQNIIKSSIIGINRICFLGSNCNKNTFGSYCTDNTFGNGCYDNTFGNDCNGNTFGNDCWSNIFGTSCQYNTIGGVFTDNTFGNGCSITINSNFTKNIIIDNYITASLTATTTPTSSNYMQNLYIKSGVSGTIKVAVTEQAYQWIIAKDSSGNIVLYCEDDAITGATVVQATGTSTEDVMSQKAVTDALNLKKSGAHIYTPFINTERWDVSAISYRDGTVTIVTDATHTNTLAVGDKISLVPKFSKTNGKFGSLNSIRPSISGIKHLCNSNNQGLLPATVTSIADNVITISAYTYAVDTTLVPDEWVLQRVNSVTSSVILLPDDVKRKPFSVEILSYGTNVPGSGWFLGGIRLGYNNAAKWVDPYWGDFALCVPLQWERYRIIDGYVLFNNLVYDSFSTINNYNGSYQKKEPFMYPYEQAINNIDSVYIPSNYYYYGQMIIIKSL